MARVKYGAIITGIKGKVGGTVFQGGRSGGVMKNNTTRRKIVENGGVGGDVDVKQVRRINFSSATKAWSFLTDGERNSWSALIGVWTFIDKFGDVYDGTAFQIFTAANINRLFLGTAVLNVAPVKIDAINFGLTLSDYSLSGSWDLTRATVPNETQYLVMSASVPANASKNASSLSFRLIGFTQFVTAGTDNIKVNYGNSYNYQPPLGSFVYLKVWTTIIGYPRKQFLILLKSEVVA